MPTMSFNVSISISTPDLMIIMEIKTPTYASRENPVSRKMIAEASTEPDRIASKSASEPDAINEPELTFLPWALTNVPSRSLTTIAPPRMISDVIE